MRTAVTRALGVGAAMLVVMAAALGAHDLFLKLGTYFVPSDTTARITVLNGTFAASEAPVAPERLRDLSLVGPEGRTALQPAAWRPAGDSTFLTLRTGAPGTYLVGASLHPSEIDLGADEFNAYLEHDGIPDVLEARRRNGELDRPARERYQKHVKAVFQVGGRRTDAFGTVLGYPAELVPLDNPYTLGPGDTLRVRCLVDGRTVAHQLVVDGGERPDGAPRAERRSRSDEAGVVQVALDAPGKWYVKFVHMVRSEMTGLDYESQWATLTFEVR